MVRWLGQGKLDKVADDLMQAIENVTSNPETRTKDMGGSANTEKVTEAVLKQIDVVFGKQ